MELNLENGVKVTRLMNSVAAGTSDTQSGTILDMAGFDGVVFVTALGTVTSTAVTTCQVQGNTANSTTGMVTLTGTSSQTDSGGANSNKLCIVGVYRPVKRYLRPQVVRATANAAIDGVFAIQYTGRTQPTVNGSTVLNLTSLVDA
jgi:hypothetical protein